MNSPTRGQMAVLISAFALSGACTRGSTIAYKKTYAHTVQVDSNGVVGISGYQIEGSYSASREAGTNPFSGGATVQYIVRSADGGATWTTPIRMTCDASAFLRAPDGSFIFASNTAGVYKSTDGAVNWNYLTDLSIAPYTDPFDIVVYAATPDTFSGNYYAIGNTYNSAGTDDGLSHALIWKSSGSTGNWTLIKDYQYTTTGNTYVRGIVTNSSGHIFVVADGVTTYESEGYTLNDYNWLTLKSTDAGASFTMNSDYDYAGGQSHQFTNSKGIAVDSSNNLYSIGASTNGTSGRWLVRKSTNGGSTWNVVDDYSPVATDQNSPGAGPTAIAINSSGHIYVAGGEQDNGAYLKWLVRKSTDGGSTWTIEDTFQASTDGSTNATPTAMNIAPNGDVYVAGQNQYPSNNGTVVDVRLFVRKRSFSTGTWSTLFEGNAD